MVRVSDYIADYLENIGVRAVFLLSGGGMMHLLDAVSRKEELKYYCNHHEQASGMAADGYARMSGQLGVCYATSGPGGTNTLTAVIGAHQDSSPVLFISGQSKVSQTISGTQHKKLRQFGTFEVDIIPMVQSATKYAAFVERKEDIRFHLEKAVHAAFEGRPGAVFLDIPVDIQGALIEPDKLQGFNPEKKTDMNPLTVEIQAAMIQRIVNAKRPLIMAGYGVRAGHAAEIFMDFANALNIPVITTPFGKDIIPYDHPLFTGHPGMKGDRSGNFAVQTADVIICVGTSLHVTTTGYELDKFAPEAHIIFVDPDPAVLEREEVCVDQKICMDVKLFMQSMLAAVPQRPLVARGAWHAKCQDWKNRYSVYKEPHQREEGKINFYDFMESLDSQCDQNDTIVTDAGSAFYIVGQAFRVKRGQRIVNSGSLGAMGFAVPAATGCALADKSRRVICITGDGSLQTNIHELATYRQNNLNIKLFVVNNDGYVCIRNTQNNFFKGHLAGTSRESGVFIPDLQKVASAYELPYISTDRMVDLESTVAKALGMSGPVICEIFTPPFQEVLPTVSSQKLADGSMQSKPLHDMYPFMSEEELRANLKF